MLTAQEKARLEELEAKFAPIEQAQQATGKLSPQEQARLQELEAKFAPIEAQQVQDAPVDVTKEASLGFGLRSKFAIEPLRSNRVALLQQELGQENVKEDSQGNIFVKEEGYFRPVNIEGFSAADVADIAGAAPEAVGALVGAPGSIPGAMAGAAVGSAARQGLSTLLGTPQVATGAERAIETGLSAGFGGLGAVAGKAAGAVKAKFFPVEKIDKAMTEAAKDIGVKLSKAQQVGGRTADLEKAFAETPFGVVQRGRINKQISQIKNNLANEVGEFRDIEIDTLSMGDLIKERAQKYNQTIKSEASALFDNLASEGQDVLVPASAIKSSLSKNLSKYNIIDELGNPKPFNVKSGLTRDQYSKVQSVLGDVVSGIEETAKVSDGAISATELNTLRKHIDSNIREAGKLGLDDIALKNTREAFLNVTEEMLGAKSKKLKTDFSKARELWKEYLGNNRILEKDLRLAGDKQIASEKALDKVFQTTKTLQQLQRVSDPETIKKAADEYLRGLLSKRLGSSGQVSAIGALNKVKEKSDVFKAALGPKEFRRLKNNLTVLSEVGKSFNPSGTAITSLRTEALKGGSLMLQRFLGRAAKPGLEAAQKSAAPVATTISDDAQRSLNSILMGEE